MHCRRDGYMSGVTHSLLARDDSATSAGARQRGLQRTMGGCTPLIGATRYGAMTNRLRSDVYVPSSP